MTDAPRFYHAVQLDPSRCLGCLNCLKRCPTEAVRIHNGKASIIPDFCVDCGECIRRCPHNAHNVDCDPLSALKKYPYTVALPAPAIYGQYNHLKDINILLTALTKIGFNDVFEVSAASELVSTVSRRYIDDHPESWPLISTSCPTIVRLMRIRFPSLLDHLLPIRSPMEVAAQVARRRAAAESGLPLECIGVFYITSCPGEASAVHDPIGIEKSQVNGVISVADIYPLLLSAMNDVQDHPAPYALSGDMGIRWSVISGEAKGQGHSHYVAADGIENANRVLEDLEDDKLVDNVKFIELKACPGGCVGGVLNVENPFVAASKLARLRKSMPATRVDPSVYPKDIDYELEHEIDFEPVYQIGRNMAESMQGMAKVEQIMKGMPGLDCGLCGCPSCRSMAEDVVRRGMKNRCPFLQQTGGEQS